MTALICSGKVTYTAFLFYLNIPMADQCYVINVKLSMLRSTAQHGSGSNVIFIQTFSCFWNREGTLVLRDSWRGISAFQRSELFISE